MQGVRLQIIRYIQLIILRFEVFKFFHCKNMEILESDIGNLYLNQDFNKMIVINSIFVSKILKIYGFSDKFLENLKKCNLILFVRAKHKEVYIKYDLDKESQNKNFFGKYSARFLEFYSGHFNENLLQRFNIEFFNHLKGANIDGSNEKLNTLNDKA
ncbi:hypothetical protein H312_01432 [Anncaliia algerae PRA339]|uniref:Uncharacterized protein n=1 Tax=Anncaliia algerae PRA339 TaxID=1288291 RepID=A0A059F1U1_9MICR|nr:hypothetical protein H312_01432 [Anncaliia algerae PRA339]